MLQVLAMSLQEVPLQMLETPSQEVPLQMQLKTPRCWEGMTGAEPFHGRQKMTRNERNDNALSMGGAIRQNHGIHGQ